MLIQWLYLAAKGCKTYLYCASSLIDLLKNEENLPDALLFPKCPKLVPQRLSQLLLCRQSSIHAVMAYHTRVFPVPSADTPTVAANVAVLTDSD